MTYTCISWRRRSATPSSQLNSSSMNRMRKRWRWWVLILSSMWSLPQKRASYSTPVLSSLLRSKFKEVMVFLSTPLKYARRNLMTVFKNSKIQMKKGHNFSQKLQLCPKCPARIATRCLEFRHRKTQLRQSSIFSQLFLKLNWLRVRLCMISLREKKKTSM